jgi:hypothetical protein
MLLLLLLLLPVVSRVPLQGNPGREPPSRHGIMLLLMMMMLFLSLSPVVSCVAP